MLILLILLVVLNVTEQESNKLGFQLYLCIERMVRKVGRNFTCQKP